MSDTLTATPTAPVIPAATKEIAVVPIMTPADPIAAARANLPKSWDATPTADAEAPPAPVEGTAPAVEGEGAAATLAVYDGFTVDAEQRLHRPDGTFADAAEIEGYNASITAPAETAPVAETPAPFALAIPGVRAEEPALEVAFEGLTPEQQEGLSRLRNGYMRGEEARRQTAAAKEANAQWREFEQLLITNPEAVILQHLPEDKRIAIATALVAQYWDQLAPALQQFDTDPTQRLRTAMTTQEQIRKQSDDYAQRSAQTRYQVQLEDAVRSLVPETVTDEAVIEQFLRDAGGDLGATMRQRGTQIQPNEVPTLLAKRLQMYAFGTAPAVAAPPARPIARPVKPAASAALTTAPKVDPGAQIRKTVTAQRIAAALPPAGAGAATVKVPVIQPGSTVEQASAALKKQRTWAQ